MTTSIFAIRHGQTQWNIDGKLQGRRDIPLCEEGIRSLELKLIPARFYTIDWYCSPLLRATATADILGLQHTLEPSLIEMHWGDWEGQRIRDLRQNEPDLMAREEKRGLDMQPPSGETPRQVRTRVVNWLKALSADTDIGIITHKGVIRALLSAAIDWDMTDSCPLKPDWRKTLCFEWNRNYGCFETAYNLDW